MRKYDHQIKYTIFGTLLKETNYLILHNFLQRCLLFLYVFFIEAPSFSGLQI